MNDSTIRLSADTSALTDSLSKIAEEMTAMKDAVSSSATAMGANFDASTKQAEATNAAIHGLDESVKTVTDSIQAQTKTVTDLGSKQSGCSSSGSLSLTAEPLGKMSTELTDDASRINFFSDSIKVSSKNSPFSHCLRLLFSQFACACV